MKHINSVSALITVFSCLIAPIALATTSTNTTTESRLLDDWFIASSAAITSPAVYENGDYERHWLAPDGRHIQAVVKIPHPSAGAPTVRMAEVANGRDARPAFLAAIAKAKTEHAGVLLIPKGTYVFQTADAPGAIHLNLANLSNLTIDGQGSTFVFTQNADGMDLNNFSQVKIENLNLQFSLKTYSVGTIENISGHNVLVVDSNYPVTAENKIGHLHEFDRTCQCKVWKTLPIRYYFDPSTPQPQYLGNQMYESPLFENSSIGKSFLIFHHYYGAPVIKMNGGNDLVFDHVTINSGPGQGFVGRHVARGLAIVNSEIVPKTGELVSTEYDGIPVSAGGDVIVEGNTGYGLGDDFINMTFSPQNIVSISPDNRTFVIGNDAKFTKENDTLYFFDDQNSPLGKANVIAVKQAGSNYAVTLDHAVENVKTSSIAKNLSFVDNRISIVNNSVEESGSILVENPNALIQSNTVVSSAISLGTMHGTFNEGSGAVNVRIEDNSVSQTPPYNGGLGMPWAAIQTFGKLANTISSVPVNRNIQIIKNTVTNSEINCISIASTDGIEVQDNNCINTNGDVLNKANPELTASIAVLKSSNVTLDQNKRTGKETGGDYIDAKTTQDVISSTSY